MSQRLRRVNEAIREIVAEQVGGLKDPRIGFVTVTDVRTSSDLRHAEVFYTALPDDEAALAATAEGLSSAKPVLRRELGARMRTRNVPDLHFTQDTVPEQGRHIEQLLRDTKSADEVTYDPATYRDAGALAAGEATAEGGGEPTGDPLGGSQARGRTSWDER